MRYFYFTLLGLLLASGLWAQQEDQFTQFMHNKLGLNPAYAGATGETRVTALMRQQWLGIEGAPQTQLVTFNMAPRKRLGVGGTISRSSIGITDRYTLEGSYAYRFELGNGYFGMGLSASMRMLQVRFNDVQANQSVDADGAIPNNGFQSRFVPNFGAGLYYNTKKFYLGVAAPRLLQNSINFANASATLTRERVHVFGMTGFVIPITSNEEIILQPHILLKYVEGAPFDADINMSVTFNKNFTGGVSYRIGGNKATGTGESIAALFSAQVSDKIMFGLSYDMTLTELRDHNSGSVELFMHYFVGGDRDGVILENPRFIGDGNNGGSGGFY